MAAIIQLSSTGLMATAARVRLVLPARIAYSGHSGPITAA